MIVPVMATSNLVLTQQIYSEETDGAHAHYREPVPLMPFSTPADKKYLHKPESHYLIASILYKFTRKN